MQWKNSVGSDIKKITFYRNQYTDNNLWQTFIIITNLMNTQSVLKISHTDDRERKTENGKQGQKYIKK